MEDELEQRTADYLSSVLGFNGERIDPVLGGYHLGNGYRLYSPSLRRFTSPDSMSPFGVGGINPYVYCEGDPINNTDPTGHFGIFIGLLMVGMMAAPGVAEAEGAMEGLDAMDELAELGRRHPLPKTRVLPETSSGAHIGADKTKRIAMDTIAPEGQPSTPRMRTNSPVGAPHTSAIQPSNLLESLFASSKFRVADDTLPAGMEDIFPAEREWGIRPGANTSVLGDRVEWDAPRNSHQDVVRQHFAPRGRLRRYKKAGNVYDVIQVPTRFNSFGGVAPDLPQDVSTAVYQRWQRVDAYSSRMILDDIFNPDNGPHVFYRRIV